MRKRIGSLVALSLVVTALAACGGNKTVETAEQPKSDPVNAEVVENNSVEISVETEEVQEIAESEELVMTPDEVRESLKDRYRKAVEEKWSDDESEENMITPLIRYIDNADDIGFSEEYDINYDGVNDYIFTDINDDSGMVLAIYYGGEDHVRPMFVSYERERCYVISFTDDKSSLGILVETSNSATESAFIEYSFLDNEINFLDAILYDESLDASNPWYKSYDADMNVENAESITEDDASAQIESLENAIVKI